MKKKEFGLITLVLALSLGLGGCGAKSGDGGPLPDGPEQTTEGAVAAETDGKKDGEAGQPGADTEEKQDNTEEKAQEPEQKEEKPQGALPRNVVDPGLVTGSWKRAAFSNNAWTDENGNLVLTASPYVFDYPDDYLSGYVNPHCAGEYVYKTGVEEKIQYIPEDVEPEIPEDESSEGAIVFTPTLITTVRAIEHKVIVEPATPVVPAEPDAKVIYLTFDDGPCSFTGGLLDILDEYNVKATFFVTHDHPESVGWIKEEAARGHSIGVHSYSHSYSTIYNNSVDYFRDFMAMEEIIYQQTGSYTNVMRFPGGVSNTVSKKYAKGIMKELAADMDSMGVSYFDWNVASNDTDSKLESDSIAQNIINGIKGKQYAVVLQHDIKPKSISAVRTVIEWGLENGYVFMGLASDSPVCHQHINN